MNYLLIILITFLLIIILLLYIHSKLVIKEKHKFDKYASLGYYKSCKYNKQECLYILNKARKEISLYNKKDICVVTVSIGNRKFSKITKKRMKEYCDLYNYDMVYFTKTLDKKFPVIWQKCVAMNKVLNMKDENGNYKYKMVVWFDDDIYITNMKYRLEDFIKINLNKDIFMPRDIIKHNYNHYINSGSYIMKNTKISRDFMKDTLNGIDLFGGHFREGVNHEQSINTYLYFSKKKYANAIEVLPYGVLQSIHNKSYFWYKNFYWIVSYFLDLNGPWEEGDFCIHFISMKENQRNEICKRIEKHDDIKKDKNIYFPHNYKITNKNWK